MATHYGHQSFYSHCMHRHIRVVSQGGMHFSEGVVWDDIEEIVYCEDCGERFSEREIRNVWNGGSMEVAI